MCYFSSFFLSYCSPVILDSWESLYLESRHISEHLNLIRASFQENGVKPRPVSDFLVSERIFLATWAHIERPPPPISSRYQGGWLWFDQDPIWDVLRRFRLGERDHNERCGPHVISLMSALLQWSKEGLMMMIHSTGQWVSQNAHLHAQRSARLSKREGGGKACALHKLAFIQWMLYYSFQSRMGNDLPNDNQDHFCSTPKLGLQLFSQFRSKVAGLHGFLLNSGKICFNAINKKKF